MAPNGSVEFAAILVGRMLPQDRAEEILREKYLGCDAPALLDEARSFLRGWMDQGDDESYLESIALYRSVIAGSSKMGDKLKARERLDKLREIRKPERAKDGGMPERELLEALANLVKRAAVHEGGREPDAKGEDDEGGPLVVQPGSRDGGGGPNAGHVAT